MRSGMIATATTPQPETPTAGPRTVLGDYSTDAGEARQLVGQRIDGIPRLTDEPSDPDSDGARYVVEPRLECRAEMDAIVADYLAKAAELGYPPMHGWY